MTDDPRDLLRRYLRQRAELGDGDLVLERLSPVDLRDLLAAPDARVREAAHTVAAALPDVPPARPERAPAAEGRGETRPAVAAAPPGATPMRPAVDAPARGVAADEVRRLPTLDAVCEVALGCPRCGLAKTRNRVVFGEGRPDARVMCVGEAPGQEEDRTGRPFVGAAGKLLDLLLQSVGLPRDAVYICNVLKCRPPGNRNPNPDEIEACSPFLLRQVELVQPEVIVAFGTFASQTLLGTDVSIGRLRGGRHQYRGVPLVPTYHPAALLRNPGWVRAVWEDLQRVRALLGAPS